ncbi:MAG: molybdopterin-dependent oxidoreductase, partial [Spirochaetia bacterium]|nr:molybdopterin-dependent oxidoreductase [Spirochaetia bacterium]
HIDFRMHSAQKENNKAVKSGEVLLVNDPYPNSEGAIRMGLVPVGGAMNATDILKNPEKLDLLFVIMDDKFIENPDLMEALTNAFGKTKNVILFSPYSSEVDSKAAVVLPIASNLEQEGTFINVDGIAQKFKPVITKTKVKSFAEIIDLLNKTRAAFT